MIIGFDRGSHVVASGADLANRGGLERAFVGASRPKVNGLRTAGCRTDRRWWTMARRAEAPERQARLRETEDSSIGAVRAVAAHLTAVELELAQARAQLAAAEVVLAATPPAARADALTVEQVGFALSLGRTTVSEMVRTGELRSVKIGKCRRVFRADLDAYIARMRAGAA